jgi:hypothetical protein
MPIALHLRHRIAPFFVSDAVGFVIFVLLYGAFLIFLSWHVTFIDQGDYGRAIYSFIQGPADAARQSKFGPPVEKWAFTPTMTFPWLGRNSASAYFYFDALIQHLYRNTFSLPELACLSKVIVLGCEALTSWVIVRRRSGGVLAACLVFAMLSLASFYAHNVAILNSLYQEHVLFIGLPLLFTALLWGRGWGRSLLAAFAMAICAMAKPQFFYVPGLFIATSLLVSWIARCRPSWHMMTGMAVAQVLGILTLLANPSAQLNHYHATFWGSYLMLDKAQIEREGVPIADLPCIGVDAWGNRMTGKDGTDVQYFQPSCVDHRPIGILQVIRPFIRHPTLLFRMIAWSMPIQFTVKYFHVTKHNIYLRAATPAGFGAGRILIMARDVREQVITRAAPAILVFALGFALYRIKQKEDVGLPGITVFLTLFIASQVVIALLGEGFRDLNKHLDAAQLALDFLVMFTLIDLAFFCRNLRRQSQRLQH